ncbi:MAG: carbohydrate ABC transporter permease [Mesorhizobium sp.]|uniref:carbohydrate ABC transporter permease n=1 Tax=Mesorhizobium sp. TaxID=1871066 RepID=UPI000FE3215F|nr:carbohydrate ABC transporter permease [Mesorhizobium sp.]RWJ04415.1 MAG: carbohydrate ABC transporter permease [Mesorhizobium sp.]RWJ15178.1 MAG: carbohydrate ABC transporter permease [Mesorhizobium sp.]
MFAAIVKRSAFYALVLAIFIVSTFPLYYAILTSFKTGTALFRPDYWPAAFNVANYVAIFSTGIFGRSLANSVLIASSVVGLSLLLAVTAAYALGRVSFRGRSLLLLTILSVSMFPQMAVLAGLFELIRWAGIYNTPFAMITSYLIFTLPFTVWVLTAFMRDLPIEIEEAAIVDGASSWVIVTRVFLPLMWPALVTTGLLAFIGAWNEFVFALTFTSSDSQRTVSVAIATFEGRGGREVPWGNLMAASVVLTIPVVVLVLIFQRRIISGLTSGSVKG